MGFLKQFYVGRAGEEKAITAPVTEVGIQTREIEYVHKNLQGDIRRGLVKINTPIFKITWANLSVALLNYLVGLKSRGRNLLSLKMNDAWTMPDEENVTGVVGVVDFLVTYNGEVFPESAIPSWTAVLAFSPTRTANFVDLNRFVLRHISDLVNADTISRYFRDGDAVSNAAGNRLDGTMRFATASNAGRMDLMISDGVRLARLRVSNTGVALSDDITTSAEFVMNTVNDYHVYRLTLQGTTAQAFVDDILRITFTVASSTAVNRFEFRIVTFAFQTVDSRWDQVRYRSLALVPPPSLVILTNTSARGITILGVFLDSDFQHIGTNFFTGGSFSEATRQITLGTPPPGDNALVLVSYTFTKYRVYLRRLTSRPMRGPSADRYIVEAEFEGA